MVFMSIDSYEQVPMTISELVYLDGELVGSREAHVSVFDYGFLYAGGVYEVVLMHYNFRKNSH